MRDWFRRQRNLARGSDAPRTPAPFIVGTFRSGTTLLRLMLDAHPELAMPPETHFIRSAVEAMNGAANPREAVLDTLTSHRRWQDFCLARETFVQRIETLEPFNLGDALRTFYTVYAERFGKPRWGDKTPAYVRHMEMIQGLLPEAHFIHIIRDGRDVALSLKNLRFGGSSVEATAQHWQSRIEEARRQSRRLEHYLEVRYEDLVSDAEATLRRVAEFIDLPWSAKMLSYHERSGERMDEMYRDTPDRIHTGILRSDRRRALHSMTNRPPQRNRVARWKEEMTADERERFEAVAAKTLRKLGYEVA